MLDDPDWTYATSPALAASPPPELSEEQLREPDGDWGWAKESPGAPRRLMLQTATAARRQHLARALRVRLGTLRRRLP